MYVNPITAIQNNRVNSVSNKNYFTRVNMNAVDTVSFSGESGLEIKKNQYKIMLTQDIWAPRLSVIMPENKIEKEALLEVLEQRQKLDRYARLTNERADIIIQLSLRDDLMEQDPSNPEILTINQNLAKRGNINSVLNTLKSQIESEAKRNKPAIEYFENLAKLEDEYFSRKLMKEEKLDKYWHQVKKNNINKDGKYSTKELIEIVKSGINPNVKEKTVVLSPKALLNTTTTEYSELLREFINVYSLVPEQGNQAAIARQIVLDNHKSNIGRYPGIEKSVDEGFKNIEKQFNRRIELFKDINIRPLGELWQQMDEVKRGINITKSQIVALEAELENDPDNEKLQMDLKDHKDKLDMQRYLWLEGVKRSVAAEKENRDIMIDHHRLSAYDYLTGKNPIINKHREILEIYTQNNNTIPEDMWDEIMI